MAKQQRAMRTRRLILDTAATMIERNGYTATSIDGISATAGTTKGAVYFHFPSKRDIAAALFDEAHDSLRQIALATRAAGPEASSLQSLIDTTHLVVRQFNRDAVTRACIQLCLEPHCPAPQARAYRLTWASTVRLLLESASVRREFREGVSAHAVAALVMSTVAGAELLAGREGRLLRPHMTTAMWRVILPGLVTPERAATLHPEGSPGIRLADPSPQTR
ncbi:ScbR family autoregulator-binding transcription factor [Streptomyces sp. NPDC002773]|uniref:ScbR family autoregulator-binding transcription factor n=1 Tax=Streptomyces sp. NPDC002773 TaxID=3154430 RepID=UPI00333221D7